MLTIDQAFRKFKSRLELNALEQQNATARHEEMRGHLRENLDLDDDFLTGSYRRYTKTKPLKDIDVFCVLGPKEQHFHKKHPSEVLARFEKVLADKYGAAAVAQQRRSICVDFGIVYGVTVDAEDKTNYRILSMDTVPAIAFEDHYEIPDKTEGRWVKSNPKIHAQEAIAAQKAYSDEWKGIVRMVKYWNNHHGKPVKPSFLLEVMALECLHPPFGGQFAYEFQGLFATYADRIMDTWPDPAGFGPPVSDMMTQPAKEAARNAFRAAEQEASNAIHLSRLGKNGEALSAWRKLFGPRFPLS